MTDSVNIYLSSCDRTPLKMDDNLGRKAKKEQLQIHFQQFRNQQRVNSSS